MTPYPWSRQRLTATPTTRSAPRRAAGTALDNDGYARRTRPESPLCACPARGLLGLERDLDSAKLVGHCLQDPQPRVGHVQERAAAQLAECYQSGIGQYRFHRGAHRLVYKVTDTEVLIAACRYHYGR
jgi:Txe/YoeB family toxin of Txe-Axe toxin-antitoxin module